MEEDDKRTFVLLAKKQELVMEKTTRDLAKILIEGNRKTDQLSAVMASFLRYFQENNKPNNASPIKKWRFTPIYDENDKLKHVNAEVI